MTSDCFTLSSVCSCFRFFPSKLLSHLFCREQSLELLDIKLMWLSIFVFAMLIHDKLLSLLWLGSLQIGCICAWRVSLAWKLCSFSRPCDPHSVTKTMLRSRELFTLRLNVFAVVLHWPSVCLPSWFSSLDEKSSDVQPVTISAFSPWGPHHVIDSRVFLGKVEAWENNHHVGLSRIILDLLQYQGFSFIFSFFFFKRTSQSKLWLFFM